jgi:hypothetical protein
MEMAEGQEKKCSYRFAINGLISVEIVILLQFKRLVTSHAWNYRFTIIFFLFYFSNSRCKTRGCQTKTGNETPFIICIEKVKIPLMVNRHFYTYNKTEHFECVITSRRVKVSY